MGTSKQIGNERLMKLAAFLSRLPPRKFNFKHVVAKEDENGCGTVCCAMGWCPAVFPKDWEWAYQDVRLKRRATGYWSFHDALRYFVLTEDEADSLFMPGRRPQYGGPVNSKPKDVARNIRAFVKARSKR